MKTWFGRQIGPRWFDCWLSATAVTLMVLLALGIWWPEQLITNMAASWTTIAIASTAGTLWAIADHVWLSKK